MTDDLTAARERHTNKQDDGWPEDHCVYCDDPWPCDAARFRDALDAQETEWERAAEAVEVAAAERLDATRDLADELAAALRAQHGPWYDDGGCICGHEPCAARAALAKWEASHG